MKKRAKRACARARRADARTWPPDAGMDGYKARVNGAMMAENTGAVIILAGEVTAVCGVWRFLLCTRSSLMLVGARARAPVHRKPGTWRLR